MTAARLIAVGRAAIETAHELILLGGVLGLASIFILVIASLMMQGWTVGSAARLLGFADRR
jgi:hypothetical protein